MITDNTEFLPVVKERSFNDSVIRSSTGPTLTYSRTKPRNSLSNRKKNRTNLEENNSSYENDSFISKTARMSFETYNFDGDVRSLLTYLNLFPFGSVNAYLKNQALNPIKQHSTGDYGLTTFIKILKPTDPFIEKKITSLMAQLTTQRAIFLQNDPLILLKSRIIEQENPYLTEKEKRLIIRNFLINRTLRLLSLSFSSILNSISTEPVSIDSAIVQTLIEKLERSLFDSNSPELNLFLTLLTECENECSCFNLKDFFLFLNTEKFLKSESFYFLENLQEFKNFQKENTCSMSIN
jgi:hypothetical protein